MGEEYIKRDEFQETTKRIHDRIDINKDNIARGILSLTTEVNDGIKELNATVLRLSNSVSKMEGVSDTNSAIVDKIHEAVFGNGNPGALRRITQVWTKVTVQWWLIAGSFTCIGLIVMAFIDHLSK
jgi:hypothetical protein